MYLINRPFSIFTFPGVNFTEDHWVYPLNKRLGC